ncbi:pyridoxal-dependent decarboxylase [Endozoicomonas arenosclerae]|uniref:pyridoxal-dependent decarboxylase n=1 Tax=Endozoicomonas arenosclerae TaxID=1633495 RepID=UPI00078207C7|nr:pyridoxal-dependent decarboxylase [Endozoicomonas arenosclerae]
MPRNGKTTALATPENLFEPLTPVYGREDFAGGLNLSAAELPEYPTPADSAYQMIKNELLMDAKPGLNLATFCNEAYTDPWGEQVVKDSIMKNFIDHTEYPGTNLAEKRSTRMLAKELGTQFDEEAPSHKQAEAAQALYGTATIGSSEAVMLGLIAHKFIWNLKQRVLLDNSDSLGIKVDARDRPVVLMSSQVHGCWDKFCRYYDAISLYIEVDGSPYSIHKGDIIKNILETDIEDPISPYAEKIRTAMGYQPGTQRGRTIGELVMAVGACVGTTFTGNSDNIPAIDDAVDNFCVEQNKKYSKEQQLKFRELYQQEYARLYPQQPAPKRIPEIMDIPVHVDAASAGFVLMFSSTGSGIPFNFNECPKRVLSINISNHKFGMTFTGMGSVIFKDSSVVDPSLVYNIAYLGGSFDDYTVNFSRGSAMIVMQYYNFLRFGRKGYRDIMDNCVENSRWFVNQLNSHPSLSKYFTNVSNIKVKKDSEGMELPIIALTWPDQNNKPDWDLVDMSDKLAQSGWVVPAYNIPRYTPEDTDGIQVLRIVVQQVVTRDKLNTLLQSMEVALNELNASGVKQTKRLVKARRNQCLC